MRRARALPAAVVCCAALWGQPSASQPRDVPCSVARLAAAGAPFPADPDTLAVRWTGYSNFELAFRNQVILLDAYFDRGSIYPPLGFTAADLSRANVILIGHGHHDHMADAASVALRTGAVVVGAPVTTEKLLTQKVPERQVRTVRGTGGELLRFDSFTVQPVLARHGEPPADVRAAFGEALQRTAPRLSPEQVSEQRAIRERGTSDPRVATEGTIAYIITLENGFRIAFRDSGGAVTDHERAAMAALGRVDLLLAATAASYVTNLTTQQALDYHRTYKPSTFMPAHHDAPLNDLWRPTEPLFQALKDADPQIVTISRGYREPACFDTRTRRR
jgi:L-ascorbate metabolism protein UlaG (beta-lactamase superfamily)